MSLRRPLGPGSRIRVVAPASAPEPDKLARGLRFLGAMGFEVQLAPLVRSMGRRLYLSGMDKERAAALMDAFADPDVDAIVCSNGGFGCQRILPYLDFDVIRANPKLIVGYSDVTVLHLAIAKEAGFPTLHGPMVACGPDYGLARKFTRDSFYGALTGVGPIGEIINPPETEFVRVVRPGRASGVLTGGNLTLVAASMGTPWEIDTRGKILFLEEWKEPPYTIDTMLHQLKLGGKFEDCAGIVFGEFPHCVPPEAGPSLWVEEVIQDVVCDLAKPVLYGFALGHGNETLSLPLGVHAAVDADDVRFTVDGSMFRS